LSETSIIHKLQAELRHIKTLTLEELIKWAGTHNEKSFRARQVYDWVWKKNGISFDQMTDIPLGFRKTLSEKFICSSIKSYEEYVSTDGTRKYAFLLSDDSMIESVLIPSGTRITACISTQVGCVLGCKFCATGSFGFNRDLDFVEIHDQIVQLMNFCLEKYTQPLSNIVMMGMGEPLLNYENTMMALDKISDKSLLNFSPQRITISTAGVVPGIKRMGDENSSYQLAISLHSAIEKKRKQMMPLTNKYPLAELTDALKYYHKKTNSRITIEYILFDGINESSEDADALAKFCRAFPVKINLIPYNSTSETTFRKSNSQKSKSFADFLESKNIIVNLRKSKGADIQAACGQLANQKEKNSL
jgi:23S rRNA (adenine2503-C2)-methyltransferase